MLWAFLDRTWFRSLLLNLRAPGRPEAPWYSFRGFMNTPISGHCLLGATPLCACSPRLHTCSIYECKELKRAQSMKVADLDCPVRVRKERRPEFSANSLFQSYFNCEHKQVCWDICDNKCPKTLSLVLTSCNLLEYKIDEYIIFTYSWTDILVSCFDSSQINAVIIVCIIWVISRLLGKQISIVRCDQKKCLAHSRTLCMSETFLLFTVRAFNDRVSFHKSSGYCPLCFKWAIFFPYNFFLISLID